MIPLKLAILSDRLIQDTFIDRILLKRLSWMKKYIEEINYPLKPESYVRASIFLSIIIFVVTIPISLIVEVLLLRQTILVSIIGAVLLSFIFSMIGLVITLYAPILKIKSLKTSINSYYPYTMLIMTSLAASGQGIHSIIEKSYKLLKNPPTLQSIQRIIKRLTKGEDISEALYLESRLTSSDILSETYEGLSYLSQTGIGVFDFLYSSLNYSIENLETKLRDIIEKLSVIMETYIIIALVFPLLTMIAVLFLGGFGGLPLPADVILIMIGFIIVPVIFIILILMTDSLTSEVKI